MKWSVSTLAMSPFLPLDSDASASPVGCVVEELQINNIKTQIDYSSTMLCCVGVNRTFSDTEGCSASGLAFGEGPPKVDLIKLTGS